MSRPTSVADALKVREDKIAKALYGRRTPLTDIQRLVGAIFFYRDTLKNDGDGVYFFAGAPRDPWEDMKMRFANLFFPALRDDNRKEVKRLFKELIEAMQWANLNARNPPGPGKSRAARLRLAILTMPEWMRTSTASIKKELARRGITDYEDSELSRAIRKCFPKIGK